MQIPSQLEVMLGVEWLLDKSSLHLPHHFPAENSHAKKGCHILVTAPYSIPKQLKATLEILLVKVFQKCQKQTPGYLPRGQTHHKAGLWRLLQYAALSICCLLRDILQKHQGKHTESTEEAKYCPAVLKHSKGYSEIRVSTRLLGGLLKTLKMLMCLGASTAKSGTTPWSVLTQETLLISTE